MLVFRNREVELMRWAAQRHLVFLSVVFVSACAPAPKTTGRSIERAGDRPTAAEPGESSRLVEKPTPPLQLAAPPPMPTAVGGTDLTSATTGQLQARGRQAAAEKRWADAATYQYWYVQNAPWGHGRYNLACYLARAGHLEPAFYWLQQAAAEEGLVSLQAHTDEDLASLQADPRWPLMTKYMVACNRYFQSARLDRTAVIVPRNYEKPMPITTIVWLHGADSYPEDLVNPAYQDLADRLNVAFVGVSGTRPRGPRKYKWEEDPEKDARRVRDALSEVSTRLTVQKGRIIAMGFSQGAQVGLEIVVRNPDVFAGAIVLSPGTATLSTRPRFASLTRLPVLELCGFVLCCGANERRNLVQLTAADADWLRRAGARVIHKEYSDVSAHAFPADFDERFSEWVKFILNDKDK